MLPSGHLLGVCPAGSCPAPGGMGRSPGKIFLKVLRAAGKGGNGLFCMDAAPGPCQQPLEAVPCALCWHPVPSSTASPAGTAAGTRREQRFPSPGLGQIPAGIPSVAGGVEQPLTGKCFIPSLWKTRLGTASFSACSLQSIQQQHQERLFGHTQANPANPASRATGGSFISAPHQQKGASRCHQPGQASGRQGMWSIPAKIHILVSPPGSGCDSGTA